jgi:ABC-type molybdate transport system substrate-binding protein
LVDSHLAVITLKGSNAESAVTTVKDLLDTKWKLGLCSASAPCGELADTVLANAIDVYGEEFDFSREALADTEATSSADLLTKLQMGELDVVLGYASSCATNEKLVCNPIPDSTDGRHLGEKSTYYVSAMGNSPATKKLMEYLYSFKFSGRLVADFGFETLS